MAAFRTLRALTWLAAVLLLVLCNLAPASAQEANDKPLDEQLVLVIEPVAGRLDAIERQLRDRKLDDQRLTQLRSELEKISGEILQGVAKFQPRIQELNTRLDRLPPVPAEGAPAEPDEIKQERKTLSDLKAKVTLAVKDAELLSVRAAQIGGRVVEQRREQFISSLLDKKSLDSALFGEVLQGAPAAYGLAGTAISSWFAWLIKSNLPKLLTVIAITLLAALALSLLMRPIWRWQQKIEDAESLSQLQRLTFAFTTTIFRGGAFLLLAVTLHELLKQFGLYRFRVEEIALPFLIFLARTFFVYMLLRAILAPWNGVRRLVDITGSAAKRLFWLGLAMAIIYGLDIFLSQLFVLYSTPVSFTIVKSLIIALLFALLLIAFVRTRLNEIDPGGPRSGYRGWYPIVYWLVWAGIVALALSAILGYVSLSRFLAGQIVVTGSILATMYIGYRASLAIAVPGALKEAALGRRLQGEGGITDMRLDQIGLLLSLLTNVLILAIGVPVLLLRWGFRWDEVFGWVSVAITGFNVGGMQISIGRLVLAGLVFFVLATLTRLLQRWFDGKVLSRTQMDAGVQNSIRSGLGYVGYLLAAIIAIGFAGFNLSNIALIAGALSVGIGFGLQNIVNNFVSGIIMLIERPIKVGDIIAVGAGEGFVKKINVRATEVETFDRQMVIIPNSEFINTPVGNWMHTDRVRRIIIRVGVSYGSDTEKVREILLGICTDDNRIATNPPPFVYFADFGASSLDFELRLFLRDIMETPVVETDLRFAIDKAFRENGIEIPFPQQDIHVRSADGNEIDLSGVSLPMQGKDGK